MSRWAVIGALVLVLAITVGDMLEGDTPQVVATVAIGPMLAAVFAGPLAVTLVVLVTLGATVVHSTVDGFAGTVPQTIRLVTIILVSALAIAVAASRQRHDRAVADLNQWQAVAQVAQRAILTEPPDHVGQTEVAVRYVSAHSLARIGGDFYDVILTPYGVRAVIGDVRGKGLEAVRLAAHCLGSFRESVHRDASLADVAQAMDAAVARAATLEDFVTAALVEIPAGATEIRVANAGHPPPLLVVPGTVDELASTHDLPLGLGSRPPTTRWALPARGRVLLYTDGAAEARREGAFFPLAEEAARTAAATTDLDRWLKALEGRLAEFSGEGLQDDVALLALAAGSSSWAPEQARPMTATAGGG